MSLLQLLLLWSNSGERVFLVVFGQKISKFLSTQRALRNLEIFCPKTTKNTRSPLLLHNNQSYSNDIWHKVTSHRTHHFHSLCCDVIMTSFLQNIDFRRFKLLITTEPHKPLKLQQWHLTQSYFSSNSSFLFLML